MENRVEIRARQKQDNARQGKAGRALEYWSAGPLEHWPLKHKPLGIWNIRLLGHQTAGAQGQHRTTETPATGPLEYQSARQMEYRTAGAQNRQTTRALDHRGYSQSGYLVSIVA